MEPIVERSEKLSQHLYISLPHSCDHRTCPTSTPGACRVLPRSRAHTRSSDITTSLAMRQMSWILGHFWLWWVRRASRRGVVSVGMVRLYPYGARGTAGPASGGSRGRRELDGIPLLLRAEDRGKGVKGATYPKFRSASLTLRI